MMSVNNERLDTDAAKMIERESDQRLLENRHERFGHIIRQWPQSRAQSGAKNESFCYRTHFETARLAILEPSANCRPLILGPFTKISGQNGRPTISRAGRAALVLASAPATTFPMAEEIVWRGTSSQWKNFGVFLLCALFCWLIVPIFIAVARYLQTKNKIYELTTERLKITEGIFDKVTDTLELYRVKDIETRQPFFYRMVGIENVQMNTSDTSSPFVYIDAIPSTVALADKIRNQVETIRTQKGVREIDIE
jgi:membrane protein YdbS with pleckstrin-like domain